MASKAIIGLDGLDPRDIEPFGFPGEWDELAIETTVHTAPSWNTIFSGNNVNDKFQMYDFWKMPDFVPDEPSMLARNSDEQFTYDEIEQDSFVWNLFDVEVVSAPIVLPTFSTLDERPDPSLTWCSKPDEFDTCMDVLTEKTLEHDRVITVYPLPDKLNHIYENSSKEYDEAGRNEHMHRLSGVAERLMDEFDEWIILSDHGRPSADEFVSMSWKLPSHDPVGVIQSNVYDTDGYTNVTVHDLLVKFYER